jgi:murein DD-endopeptidase MepM/ murein hydrolase activator NlpD
VPEKHRILAQLSHPLALHAAPRWIVAFVAALGSVSVIGALSSATNGSPDEQRKVIEALAIKAEAAASDEGLPFVREEVVRPGDSLRSLTQRMGLDDHIALEELLGSTKAREGLSQLKTGRPASAMATPSGQLLSLTLPIGQGGERLRIERTGASFAVFEESRSDPTAIEMRSGVIASSLFAATDAADVPDAVASQLVELLSTEIDFHTDLRRGDQFRVVFEAGYQDGRLVSTGRILAAEFVNQGKTHRVFLFRDAAGRDDYYTDSGQSLKQGFLRSPLEFSRVTSGFSLRLHPILKTWRQHQGVDFGAPTGTAVKATADGTVEFVGTQGGYGNIVVLKHRDGYSTAYGHLSGFARGLGKNSPVSQGQIIGYVGQTGWATGPHLHYEFRVAGTPRDPLTVPLPVARPILPREMGPFRENVAPMRERLALLRRTTQPSTQ